MRKSTVKNDRPDRIKPLILSPMMSMLTQAFKSRQHAKGSVAEKVAVAAAAPLTLPAIHFETLEPRVLLAGDVNPAALTIDGAISVQGEQDRYEFTVQETHRVVFDSLTNRSDLTWSLGGSSVLVTNRSFAEMNSSPALELTAGKYTLTVDGKSDALGDYSLRIIDADVAADLTPGVEVSGTLDTGNKTSVYRFNANAGDKFYFDALGITGGNATWRLIDPNGLQENYLENVQYDKDTFSLKSSGSYLLLVEGRSYNTAPVTYRFNLLPVQDGTAPLELDKITTANIDKPGKSQVFNFKLSEHASVAFDSLTNSWNSDKFYWTLSGPTGEQVARRKMNSTTQLYGAYDSSWLELPAGDYKLTVDAEMETKGSADFRLFSRTAATEFTPGNIVNGSVQSMGLAMYRVSLQAGDRIVLDGRAATNGEVKARLLDAYGAQVMPSSVLTAVHNPIDVTASGDYWLLLDAGTATTYYTQPVGFEFALQRQQQQQQTAALTFDDIVSVALASLGTTSYTFTLNEPTTLVFDALESSLPRYSVQWRLTSGLITAHDYWGEFNPSYGGGSENILALPPARYTLTMRNQASQPGNVKFRVLTNESATLFTPGTTVSTTLNSGNNIQIYRFSGTQGERYYFDRIINSADTTFLLIDPSGRVTNQVASWNSLQSIELPATGEYLVMLSANFNYSSSPQSYSFNLLPHTVRLETLSLGTDMTGSLSQFGQSVKYSFFLENPTAVLVNTISGSAYWSLSGPRGSEASQRYFSSEASVLNLLAGQYEFTVTGSGYDRSTDYSFQLSDLAAAPVMALGTPIELAQAAETGPVVYQLNVAEDQEVFFDSLASSTNYYWASRWRIVGQQGYNLSSGGMGRDSGRFTLAAGSYFFVVDASPDQNFAFEFALRRYSVHKTVPIELDTEVDSALDEPSQRATYAFTVNAPTRVLFDSLTDGSDLEWVLSGPSGTLSYFSPYEDQGYSEMLDLATAGQYTLQVSSRNNLAVPVKFRLLDLNAIATQDLASIQRVELNPGNGSRVIAFDSSAGDYFVYRNTGLSGGQADVLVFDADGQLELSASSALDDITEQLPSGRHYLVIKGDLSNTGPVQLNMTARFARDHDAPLILGEECTGSIDAQNVPDTWRFTLNAKTRVLLDGLYGQAIGWSLYDVGNHLIADAASMDELQVLELGPNSYHLVMHAGPDSGDVPGAYGFKLRDLSEAAQLVTDTPVSAVVQDGHAAALYTISLPEDVYLHLQATETNAQAGRVVVFDSQGQQIAASTLPAADLEFRTDGIAGDFLVVVDGNFANEQPLAYTLIAASLQESANPQTPADALVLTLDTATEGTLGEDGTLSYQFDVTGQTLLWLDALNEQQGVNWRIADQQGNTIGTGQLGMPQDAPTRLLVAGTYTLTYTLEPIQPGQSVNVAFKLANLGETAAPLALDTSIEATLTPGNGLVAYQFDALAYDNFQFESSKLQGNNNTLASAQDIARSAFGVSPSVDVGDASLPRVQIRGMHDSSNDADFYAFHLQAGETLILDVDYGQLETMLVLYDESGTDQEYDFGGWDDAGSTSSQGDAYLEYTASVGGTYYVAIAGDWQWPDPVEAEEAGYAAGESYVLNVSINPVPDSTGFGVAAQVLGESGEGANAALMWRLYSQSGALVGSGPVGVNSIEYQLVNSGASRYYLLIDGQTGNTEPVDYQFSAKLSSSALALNTPVTASVAPGSSAHYNFHLTEASRLAFYPQSWLEWRLNGPQGMVFDGSMAEIQILLLEPGYYALTLINSEEYRLVDAKFKVLDVRSMVTPISVDAVVSSTLNPDETMQLYSFTATADEVYSFSGLPSTSGNWRLFGPDGQETYGTYPSLSNRGGVRITESGTYLLSFVKSYYAVAGQSYTFKVVRATEKTPLSFNVNINDTVAGGAEHFYTLHLDQTTWLAFDSLSTNTNLTWQLNGPDGQIFNSTMGDYYSRDVMSRFASGDYTLTVNNKSELAVSYGLRVLDSAGATPIIAGTPTTINITPANGMKVYSFHANAGERYYFDHTLNTGNGYWRLVNPLGNSVINQALGYDTEPSAFTITGTYLLVFEGMNHLSGALQSFTFNVVQVPDNPPIVLDTLVIRPAPDLYLNSVSVTPSAGLQTGGTVQVQWVVENRGVLPTSGNWNDSIVLRNLDNGQLLASFVLPYEESVTGNGAIAPGTARTRSATITLPDGELGAGRIGITVAADSNNAVRESNNSATGESNNIRTVQVQVALAPYADLVVENLTLTPDGDFVPGWAVELAWNTANRGTADVTQSWSERIEIRNLSTNEVIHTSLLHDSVLDNGLLSAGSSRSRTHSFIWPSGVSAAGRLSFRILLDTDAQIVEANLAGSGETNNTAEKIRLSGPDLRVKNLQVVPSAIAAGGLITLNWEDWNDGRAPTPANYSDRIVIVNKTTGKTLIDTSILYDTSASGAGLIAANSFRARSFSYRLPEGLQGTGNLEIKVTADQNSAGLGVLFETNLNGDAESNNSAVVQTSSAAKSYADLGVSILSAPEAGIGGQPVTVSWSVSNHGNADSVGSPGTELEFAL